MTLGFLCTLRLLFNYKSLSPTISEYVLASGRILG